jgi:hypothetical protein
MSKPFEVEILGGDRMEYLQIKNLVNDCLKRYNGQFGVQHIPTESGQPRLRLVCTGVHAAGIEDATLELRKLGKKLEVLNHLATYNV